MEQEHEGQKLAVAELVAKIFGIVMVVLYIVIGTTIIIKAPDFHNYPEHYAVIFGVMLILYGIFRAYKLYRRHFSGPKD